MSNRRPARPAAFTTLPSGRAPDATLPAPRTVRCAIYTRKSTEEGLQQAFNSLDAQREAAEACVLSMKHEGWTLVRTRYDDDGYGGGNAERPGLKALMTDISVGRVDCVVVYKVDRLSRSLLDFARLMAVFEQHRVSFVSVTRQFNTACSMARLTLNVLMAAVANHWVCCAGQWWQPRHRSSVGIWVSASLLVDVSKFSNEQTDVNI